MESSDAATSELCSGTEWTYSGDYQELLTEFEHIVAEMEWEEVVATLIEVVEMLVDTNPPPLIPSPYSLPPPPPPPGVLSAVSVYPHPPPITWQLAHLDSQGNSFPVALPDNIILCPVGFQNEVPLLQYRTPAAEFSLHGSS